MAESHEFVDINHPYITEHSEKEFVWGFDDEKAMQWAAAVIGQITAHAIHGGPEHAFDLLAVQAGILLEDVPKDTQLPVLMMAHGDEKNKDYTPVAVLLPATDRVLNIAHTMGNLIDDDGVHPALPSAMNDDFYNPPVKDGEVDYGVEPSSRKPPTTVFDILATQREETETGGGGGGYEGGDDDENPQGPQLAW